MAGSLVLSGGVGVSAVPVYGEPGPFSSGSAALEQGYESNMPVTIYDPSGSTAPQMQFPNSPIVRLPPAPARVTAPEWLEFAAPWMTWLLIVAALLLLVYVIRFRDRAKGLRRCPKCWYDMSATAGMRCPECGREQETEKRFRRRRRSWRLASLAVVLLLVSYAASVAVDVYEKGWMWGVPRWALVAMAPSVETMDEPSMVQKFTGSGWVWAEEPKDWTLDQELWEHLYTKRVPRGKLTWIEYRILRDDLFRRFKGEKWNQKIARFVSSQHEWILRDDELLIEILRESLVQKLLQRRAGAVQFWLNRHDVYPTQSRAQWMDYTLRPPRWVDMDWDGLPPTVSIAQSGEHKDALKVRFGDTTGGGPVRWIEFDVVLDESFYERYGR